jgi:ParB family chromosome partitioning protein
MTIQMIPLNKLTRSPANVRKTGADHGIDELAASIAAHGLLQNLQVRASSKGKFEVIAGGRRLAALTKLAKEKTIEKTAEIACHVIDGEDATEISLAENVIRLQMHPADQFAAFKSLVDAGQGIEDIAARFGTPVTIVRQRLKLASVSPRLMEVYRKDGMTLDQLMAFTVSEDHDAQESVWFDQPSYNRDARTIRRLLTSSHVPASSKEARFVGLDAYTASGGVILRDLFQPEHEGYLTNPDLLNRLVIEKLEQEAEAVRAEGWRWVEIRPELDYGELQSFGKAEPQRQPLAEDKAEELDRLNEEYETLIEEQGEGGDPELDEKLDDLLQQIEALAEGETSWRAEDLARCGAVISIGYDGAATINRGLIRAEDMPHPGKAGANPKQTATGGLSARLVEDLSAHRTAALRVMVEDNQALALATLAHALALPIFYGSHHCVESCLDIQVKCRDLKSSAEGIADSKAGAKFRALHTAWQDRLPQEAADLFNWLLMQNMDTINGILAHCAAASIDGVQGKLDHPTAPRLKHADQVADTLGLDMAKWWEPTRETYLGRVSKARILEAVTEGVSKGAADNIAMLKKDTLIARAEEKLAGKGWIPAMLRRDVPVMLEAMAAE